MDRSGVRKQIAATALMVIFNISLTKYRFEWMPDWVLVVAWVGIGAYWLSANPQVRLYVSALSGHHGTGALIDPSTKKPIERPNLFRRKAKKLIAICGFISLVVGCVGWQARKYFIRPLEGDIENVAIGNDSKQPENSAALVEVGIINHGPPTIVQEYTLRITNEVIDSTQIASLVPWQGVKGNRQDGSVAIVVLPVDQLIAKAGNAPIPTGGKVDGWILFQIPNIPLESLREHKNTWELSFQDSNANKYKIIWRSTKLVEMCLWSGCPITGLLSQLVHTAGLFCI